MQPKAVTDISVGRIADNRYLEERFVARFRTVKRKLRCVKGPLSAGLLTWRSFLFTVLKAFRGASAV